MGTFSVVTFRFTFHSAFDATTVTCIVESFDRLPLPATFYHILRPTTGYRSIHFFHYHFYCRCSVHRTIHLDTVSLTTCISSLFVLPTLQARSFCSTIATTCTDCSHIRYTVLPFYCSFAHSTFIPSLHYLFCSLLRVLAILIHFCCILPPPLRSIPCSLFWIFIWEVTYHIPTFCSTTCISATWSLSFHSVSFIFVHFCFLFTHVSTSPFTVSSFTSVVVVRHRIPDYVTVPVLPTAVDTDTIHQVPDHIRFTCYRCSTYLL